MASLANSTLMPAAHASRLSRGRRFVHIASLYEQTAVACLADEEPPYTPEPWHAVAAIRPDTAHVRALRFLDAAGEIIGGFVIIVGGMGLVGLASLVGGVA